MRRLFTPRALLVPAIVSALLVFAACNSGDAATDTDAGDNPGGDTTSNSPAADPVTEIVVSMHDDYFEPAEFTVRTGTTVTITAKNEGRAVHNLAIRSSAAEGQDFQSEQMIRGGDEDTFEATFTTPGEYRFECDFHLPGMVGTLTVID